MSSQPPFLKRQVSYYVSLSRSKKRCLIHHTAMGTPLGVDLGIKAMAMGSDGTGHRESQSLAHRTQAAQALAPSPLSESKRAVKIATKPASVWPASTPASPTSGEMRHHQATSLSHPRPSLSLRRTSRTARPDCFHLAGTESQGQTKEGQAISGNADRWKRPPCQRWIAKKVKKKQIKRRLRQVNESDAALASTRWWCWKTSTSQGMKREPQASSCYLRRGLGGVSTANALQDRVARGRLPACRPLLPLDQKMLQPDVWQHQRGDGPL